MPRLEKQLSGRSNLSEVSLLERKMKAQQQDACHSQGHLSSRRGGNISEERVMLLSVPSVVQRRHIF